MRGGRPLLVGLVVAFLALTALAGGWAATARAQAPTVVYDERFENGVDATPVILTAYTGAAGERYTAAPAWLTACNGRVLQFNSPNSDLAASGCGALGNYGRARQLAYALGVHGGVTPATNHAVSAYTENNPGPNNVEFETVGELLLPTSGRFLTFQVDAAAVNCPPVASAPLYQFSLTSGVTSTPVGGLINACSSTGTVTVPAVAGAVGAIEARIGTFTSNGSVLFTGPSLGIRMLNGNGSGIGNDAAFDNIRVLDATPRSGKSFSPATLNAGGTSTLTFTITNTTELAAKNGWSLTDTLPAGLFVTSPVNTATTCSGGQVTAVAGGGSVTVSGNLGAGQASCTANVDVTASAQGTYTNGPANVTTTGLEPPPPSTVQFLGADLALVKTASPGAITPGANVTYTLAVTNQGPDTAVNVRVSDPLPAGLTFVSASAGCSAAAADVSCAAGSLAAGASQTFTVTASVAGSIAGGVANTATVTSDTPDPNQGNNTSTVTVTVQSPPLGSQPPADLAVAKEGARTGAVGRPLEYRIVVRNKGPGAATAVRVTNTLSAPARLVAVTTSAGSCRRSLPVTCSLGTIEAGGSVTITVVVEPRAAGTLRNVASVTGEDLDPETADNTAVVTTRVKPALELTKVAERRKVRVGQTVTYTIRVRNPSDAAIRTVRTCDLLPPGLAYVSSKSRARPSKGRYCWTAKRLGPGEGRTYRLAARALSGTSGRRVNRATATSRDTGNARARRAVRVQAPPAPSGGVTG
jgi:uncharacterized repeat protein (TIGR01451 family)